MADKMMRKKYELQIRLSSITDLMREIYSSALLIPFV